jgi:iron complex transport system substrate-binding protein
MAMVCFSSLSRVPLVAAIGLCQLVAALPARPAEGEATFADTSRIAAIGGSITKIVYALGEQGHLVARDWTSHYPQAALELPDVGYMRQLSPEGVVNPSGILALDGSGPKEAVDVLKKSSIPFIEVPEHYSHEGFLEKIHVVGKALGADVLAAEVDAKLKAAERQTASIKDRKRILFVLSTQGGKILAAGGDTAADGIIKLSGGVNAVEGFSGYKQMSDEAIVTARPDAILIMTKCWACHLGSRTVLESVDCLDAGGCRPQADPHGWRLPAWLFGPRTADAIHELAVSLYGGQVTD